MERMAPTRFTRLCVLLPLLALACTPSVADPPEASSPPSLDVGSVKAGNELAGRKMKVIGHNLAGGLRYKGSESAVAVMVNNASNFGAHILLLQEVCKTQYTSLKTELQGKNWASVQFTETRPRHPDCPQKGPQGLVVASKYTMSNVNSHNLGYNTGTPGTESEKVFKMLCGDISVPSYPVKIRACSTHLRSDMDAADSEARFEQAKTIRNILGPAITNDKVAVIVAGDFNSEPDRGPAGQLYALSGGQFVEGDQRDNKWCATGTECRNGAPTKCATSGETVDCGNVGNKIDYIFFSNNRVGNLNLATKVAGKSDHLLLKGEAYFDLSSPDNRTPAVDPNHPDEPVDEPDAPPPPPTDYRLDRRVFNVAWYMGMNDDLVAVFGPGNYPAAEYHWLTYGINEGRVGSPTFDASWYLAKYPDVAAACGHNRNYLCGMQHYLNNGIREGREGSMVFNPIFYMNTHTDVASAWGATNYAMALEHFYNNGIFESRESSPTFNVAWYFQTYPDVAAAWPGNNGGAMAHYLKYGRHDRWGSPRQIPSATTWYNWVNLSNVTGYRNLSNGQDFSKFGSWSADGAGGTYLRGDFNGDKKTDLLLRFLSNGVGYNLVYLSTGNSFMYAGNWLDAGNVTHARVGDFNGDGRDDLLLAYPTGSGWANIVALSAGTHFYYSGNWNGDGAGTQYYTGDFNGDKKTDLLFKFQSGSTHYNLVYLSTGSSFYWNGNWIDAGGASSITVGDFNGDGRDDLNFAYPNGSAWVNSVALSQGTHFAWAGNWSADGAGTTYHAGDFNGDRKTDLLLRLVSNGVRYNLVYTSTGSAFGYAGNWMYQSVTNHTVNIGDFNGDGRADILSSGYGGQ